MMMTTTIMMMMVMMMMTMTMTVMNDRLSLQDAAFHLHASTRTRVQADCMHVQLTHAPMQSLTQWRLTKTH